MNRAMEAAERMIRVLIAALPDIELTGVAADGEEAVRRCREARPTSC